MAGTREIVVKADQLRAFCVGAYEKLGLAKQDAEIAADPLVEAKLRGKSIQGVGFLPYSADRIRQGSINSHPRIRVLPNAPALLVLTQGLITQTVDGASVFAEFERASRG